MIPLVDLHRHYAGCLDAVFIHEISRRHGLGLSYSDVFAALHDERRDFKAFVKRFDIQNKIPWTEQDIADSVIHVVDGLHSEHIRYAEVRFSIGKFRCFQDNKNAALFIARAMRELAESRGIKVSSIFSVKYESTHDFYAALEIVSHQAFEFLDGVDFVGDEAFFDSNFGMVNDVVKKYQDAKKAVLMHIGETCGCDNIKKAYDLGVRRIVHGIRIVDDPVFMAKAAKDCVFYLSPTSNVETGVIHPHEIHPGRRMLDAGCQITIGTDDPAILRTNLRHEYVVARAMLRLNDEEIETIKGNSIRHAVRSIAGLV